MASIINAKTPNHSSNPLPMSSSSSSCSIETEKTEKLREQIQNQSSFNPKILTNDEVGEISFSATVESPSISAQIETADSTKQLYSYEHNGLIYSFEVKGQILGFSEKQWLEIICKINSALPEENPYNGSPFVIDLSDQTIIYKKSQNENLKPIHFDRKKRVEEVYSILEKYSGMKIAEKDKGIKMHSQSKTLKKSSDKHKTRSKFKKTKTKIKIKIKRIMSQSASQSSSCDTNSDSSIPI